jgi:hypothetical protein
MQNLDFFFLNSAHPLSYIEEPGETPVFVSIITDKQKEAYIKAGYKPVIIDENAGDVDQYYLLSGHRHKAPNAAEQIQNPEYEAQGIVLASKLSTYYTLLKLTKGKKYQDLTIPALNDLYAKQFHWNLVPNADRTSTQVQQAFPFSPVPRAHISADSNEPAIDSEWMLSLFFLIVISVFLYFALKRKKN